MTAKHTPGPWHYERLLRLDGMPLNAYEILEPCESSPGFSGDSFRHIAETTCEENARLIAAAPELLAALEGVKALIPAYIPADGYTPQGQMLTIINAAIAKARGE